PGDQALVGITAAAVTAKLQDEASMKAKLLERPSPKNWSYSVQGSASVTPDAAWDDGKFTYFRFVGTREMPAIFLVNEDGSERLV
ncbi:TrbG/VirB9 family P-type conjugative transfer protein, partial [Acinetobacter baumannii]